MIQRDYNTDFLKAFGWKMGINVDNGAPVGGNLGWSKMTWSKATTSVKLIVKKAPKAKCVLRF